MAEKAKRREVVASVEEAARLIQPGMTIMLGGFGTVNHSMAIVRQLIRNRVTDLTVVGAATAGLDVDMLIGAGCVRKVIAPYVGAELLCPIGHCFRNAAEHGSIEIWECSEYILYAALYARTMGLGFMPWRGGLGTDIPRLNPDLKEFSDPIKGERYLAVPAIEADWALIHVGWADPYGNGQHLGARFGDRLFARAADRVMLTTERIVPNSVIRRNPFMTSIAYADVVVETPYGSHPFASHGFYGEDLEHIQEYVRATDEYRRGHEEPWRAYLAKYVQAPSNHDDYLELIGARRLLGLQQRTAAPVGGL
jgi:glutaconate CoA-transferase subunit A